MKLRAFLTIFFMACMTSICFGQAVRDKSNMLIGKIESDGTVRDRSNMLIGHFEKDGTIRDKSNMKIGHKDMNVKLKAKN